jgi:hypothetical protein
MPCAVGECPPLPVTQKIITSIYKKMSIQVDGEFLENVIELENYLEENTPNMIVVNSGPSEKTFAYMQEEDKYNCQYISYPIQFGVGFPRAGFCGNLTKAEVLAEVRTMLPVGGRRRAHTKKQKARKNHSRKHRGVKARH